MPDGKGRADGSRYRHRPTAKGSSYRRHHANAHRTGAGHQTAAGVRQTVVPYPRRSDSRKGYAFLYTLSHAALTAATCCNRAPFPYAEGVVIPDTLLPSQTNRLPYPQTEGRQDESDRPFASTSNRGGTGRAGTVPPVRNRNRDPAAAIMPRTGRGQGIEREYFTLKLNRG